MSHHTVCPGCRRFECRCSPWRTILGVAFVFGVALGAALYL